MNGLYFLSETDLTTKSENFCPYVLHHLDQLEGADMGLADSQNFLRCACLYKLLQYLASQVSPILDLAVQFSIGEGASATLAKLYIGFCFQFPFAPQSPGIFSALPYVQAAFYDDGAKAHLRQQQSCQDTAGAKADDNGGVLAATGKVSVSPGHKLVTGIGAWPNG